MLWRGIKLFTGLTVVLVFAAATPLVAQDAYVSDAWVSDLGNGSYKNPVLHADYSDPDVCRAGEDYYLVASSFDAVPGLPILHSKDLVNWRLLSHALKRQPPFEHFEKTQHGNGVWAPAIRYHHNKFYIYYPDPDFGIYMVKADTPEGPWTEPVLIEAGKGLIDPCPLWDDDGSVYLVHAYAGSRAGIKSVLVIKRMNADGTRTIDEGVIVYDGHEIDPTIEGPKLHKREGYYYIFAPAGGVSTGWQTVLRSKNIYGPYERRVVMHRGSTAVNGPHQGAWVDTPKGEHWFVHFQDKGPYGRVVHLQPLRWVAGWPVIGDDKDGDGKGEPVPSWKKPDAGKNYPVQTPADSDEFNGRSMGLQWQWQANPKATWAMFGNNGSLRLYAHKVPDSATNLWDVPNVLMQKFPADAFVVTTKLSFKPSGKARGERAGLVIMGEDYAALVLSADGNSINIEYVTCANAPEGKPETAKALATISGSGVFLRCKVAKGAVCAFSYSTDGEKFVDIKETFQAKPGRWIGAKVGLFCTRTGQTNDSGYADFDWFRVHSINDKL